MRERVPHVFFAESMGLFVWTGMRKDFHVPLRADEKREEAHGDSSLLLFVGKENQFFRLWMGAGMRPPRLMKAEASPVFTGMILA